MFMLPSNSLFFNTLWFIRVTEPDSDVKSRVRSNKQPRRSFRSPTTAEFVWGGARKDLP